MVAQRRCRRLLTLVVLSLLFLLLLLLYTSPAVWSVFRWIWPLPQNPSVAGGLHDACLHLSRNKAPKEWTHELRLGVAYACRGVGIVLPWGKPLEGCGRTVTYAVPGDRDGCGGREDVGDASCKSEKSCEKLHDLMDRYAVLYGFSKVFGAEAFVDAAMWKTMTKTFPGISLPHSPTAKTFMLSAGQNVPWREATFREAQKLLSCPPDLPALLQPHQLSRPSQQRSDERKLFRITDPPDGWGLQLIRPVLSELRSEFSFCHLLLAFAQNSLLSAQADRTPTTFIGVHLEAENKHHDFAFHQIQYILRAMNFYRQRFTDSVFIAVAANASAPTPSTFGTSISSASLLSTTRAFLESLKGVVFIETADEAKSLALLAACNHSIVTGQQGFWGAVLAGGYVVAPAVKEEDLRAGHFQTLLEAMVAEGRENWFGMA